MKEKPFFTSDALSTLRALLEHSPELEKHIGKIARFKVVLDANMAIGDLLHKARHPKIEQTRIEEVYKSGVITLFAPTWLDEEMLTSAIPKAAKKRKVSEETLLELWADYKKNITWDDGYTIPDGLVNKGDDKDIPYVALQQSLGVAAVLSNDRDIDDLGGTRVDVEFTICAQTYARTKAVAVGIQVGGLYAGYIGFGAFIQLLKGIGKLVGRLPAWAQVSLLIISVVAIAHPTSRAWLMDRLSGMGQSLFNVWPEIDKLIQLGSEMQEQADQALSKADQLFYAKEVFKMTDDFTSLSPQEMARVAVERIEEDGLFWIPMTRTPSENVMREVETLLEGSNLYLHSPLPDWDHVIIDIERHPTWSQWIKEHAHERHQMKGNGVPDHELPALPKGI